MDLHSGFHDGWVETARNWGLTIVLLGQQIYRKCSATSDCPNICNIQQSSLVSDDEQSMFRSVSGAEMCNFCIYLTFKWTTRIEYATKLISMNLGNLNRVSMESASRLYVNSADLPMSTISEHVPSVWKTTRVKLHFALNVIMSSDDRRYASSLC